MLEDFPDWSQQWIQKKHNNLHVDYLILIKDYLVANESEELKRKLFKMPLNDILNKSLDWHDKILKQSEIQKNIKGNSNDIRKIISFNDGYSWVSITSKEGLDFEGNAMGHCVGQGGYDNLQKNLIISLRDKSNMPHVTIQVNHDNKIQQIQGKGNKPINKKYYEKLIQLINQEQYKFSNIMYTSIIKNSGLIINKDNVLVKIQDLETGIFHLPNGLLFNFKKQDNHMFAFYDNGFLNINSYHPSFKEELEDICKSYNIKTIISDTEIHYCKINKKIYDNPMDYPEIIYSSNNKVLFKISNVLFKEEANASVSQNVVILNVEDIIKQSNIETLYKILNIAKLYFNNIELIFSNYCNDQNIKDYKEIFKNFNITKIYGLNDFYYCLNHKNIYHKYNTDIYPSEILLEDNMFKKTVYKKEINGKDFILELEQANNIVYDIRVRSSSIDDNDFADLKSFIDRFKPNISTNIQIRHSHNSAINFIQGKNKIRQPMSIYRIDEMPYFIKSELHITDYHDDIILSKKITMIEKYSYISLSETIDIGKITINNCSGMILLENTTKNKVTSLTLTNNTGLIILPSNLERVKEINILNSWNFGNMSKNLVPSHPINITLPDGTTTNSVKYMYDVIKEIQQENKNILNVKGYL
jgi:hypothetical protein